MRKIVLVSALLLSACANQMHWPRPPAPVDADLGVDERPAQIARTDLPVITIAPTPQSGQVTFRKRAPVVQPTAKGMELMDGSIDGAIVCSSLNLSEYIYGRINVARHMQAHLPPDLRRQAALIKGYDESQEPRLADYGCVLVPVGTPLTVEPGNYVPVVSGKLPNGRRFSGVTLPAMVNH